MGFLAALPAVADVAGTAAASIGVEDAAIGAATAAAASSTATAAASSIPAWLSYGGVAASALSGVTGAVGAAQSANAQRQAANYQAQVAKQQSDIANQQAQQTAAAGEAATEQQGLKTRATVGAVTANEAASGVDVNSGSALDTRLSAADVGELNALTTRSNYARQAYGYQTGAVASEAQSGLYRAEASQAPIGGALSATGSLLSGASSAANQYARWQQAGGSGAIF